jgi:hypothetical protein
MSDMRRAARGLVESRTERFPSAHPVEESRRRLEAALPRAAAGRHVSFEPRWESHPDGPVLEATFAPVPRTLSFMKALSLGMALLVVASAWAVVSEEASGTTAFLVPMITVLATLGFPFLVLGLASQREAEEARIRRVIRVALLDEEERWPPPKRWADED